MVIDKQLEPAVLDSLTHHLQTEGLVVLAGAGVSLASPSCAPLFRPLRDGLLRSLSNSLGDTLDVGVQTRLKALFSADSEIRRGVEPVPEVLFEAVHARFGDRLFDALRILLSLPSANSHHRFLAGLAGSGLRLLITTNFEDGFEQALAAAGLPFDVSAEGESISRSLKELDEHAHDSFRLPIWKVHGTLEPGAEDSIRVTLSQVAKERLDPHKFEPIVGATTRLPLLVIGYSGYDADLSRTLIRAAEQGRELYWLSYQAPGPQDPAVTIVNAWQDRGHLLVGDLSELLSSLSERLPDIPAYKPPAGDCDTSLNKRFEDLDTWTATVAVNDQLAVLAALCWKLADYESALAVLDALQRNAENTRDGNELVSCLILRTNILRSAGRGQEIGDILKHLQSVRTSIGDFGDPEYFWLDAMLLHEMGGYFKANGQPKLAEDAYRKALAVSVHAGKTETVAAVAQSLGALLSHDRRLTEAAELFDTALKAAIESGNRYAEMQARHEQGIVAYESGDVSLATSLLTENVRLAHDIGSVDIEASSAFELGIIALRELNDYPQADRAFTESKRLATLIGNKSIELQALLYLGDSQQTQERYEESVVTLTDCIEKAMASGHGAVQATGLARRARSHATLAEFEHARADLASARMLAEQWHPALLAEIDALGSALDQV